jgi:hypothetical protein
MIDMNLKLKSIFIIIILILSILIINLSINLPALNLDIEKNDTSRSYGQSRDGPFDWGEIEVISEPTLKGDINSVDSVRPSIAIEDDKIYMVWEDAENINGAGSDFDIFYRYFDGDNWSDIQVISEPIKGLNINDDISSGASIAVENNNIFVVWHDYTDIDNSGSDGDIFFRCNLSGSGWGPIQIISEPIIGIDSNPYLSGRADIAVENGKIYVVWHDHSDIFNSGRDADIFFICNLTGSNWEDIQIISEPIFGFNIHFGGAGVPKIVIENGKIYIVWTSANNTYNAGLDQDIFFRCNITGSNWEDVQVISEPVRNHDNNVGISEVPSISIDNGKIYVAWMDDNNTNNAGTDMDIFLRYNLTGSDWEEIQIISEPIPYQNFNIESSSDPIIECENNNIYIVWQDQNDTKNSGGDKDIFLRCSFSTDVWQPIQIISEPLNNNNFNAFESKYPDIEIDFDKCYFVWQDQNDTNGAKNDWDIFFRPLYLVMDLHSFNISPGIGDTSTIFNFTISYEHLLNIPPKEIILNIDNIEYSMLETDLEDTNYMDGKDYFYNIRNINIGSHITQFNGSIENFALSIKLINKPVVFNTPPVIITEDNFTAFENSYYEVDYDYEDIDVKNVGQEVTWLFSSNASWLVFDSNNVIIYGTPINKDIGTYWVNISVTDSKDGLDFHNFTIKVKKDTIQKNDTSDSFLSSFVIIYYLPCILLVTIIFLFYLKNRKKLIF